MFLSVIVPAFNEEALLGITLAKIKAALYESRQVDYGSWEIIVCDNNSTDQTAEIARNEGALVVSEPVNQISRARNTGANAAKGQWLLFIDADSYPTAELITETVELIRTGEAIGCTSTIKVKGGPFWYRLRLESRNFEIRLFKSCVGVYLLCEAGAFRRLGGFSIDLFALEELEFAKRLKAYAKKAKKKFVVLYRHPVITSGRKGELRSKWAIAKSMLLALWCLITGHKIKSQKSLPYWYSPER